MESDARPISDRWELTERIGSGAMGEVWRGRHRVLNHDVAVKVMKRDASRDQSMVARFLREARIAAQLRHRNVARVEDFGTTPEGKPFLVMELLQGRSLEDMIERGERLSRARVLTVARHVGAACDVAHAEGIVHRDLKPANCFLVRDEDGADLVKVLDFGVAKVSDGLLATQHAPGGFSLLGTPMYMSPEQARGDEVLDGRSDLWSLGVMIYELLTGQLPFNGDSLPLLLLAIQSQQPAPPSAHDPTLSPSVDAWVRRALARDASHRFRTGGELAEALSIALAGSVDPRSGAPPPYAPTAQLPVAPAAPAPNTLAPTQPMRAVDVSLAPPPPAPAPPPAREPSVSSPAPSIAPAPPRDLRPLIVVSALLILGAGVFAVALLRRGEAEVPVAPSPRVEAPARPIPVTPVAAPARVAAPAPAPTPPPARPAVVTRPARTAPATAPPPRVARPAPPTPEPHIEPSPMVIPAPPPVHTPPPAPPPSGTYNPDQP